MRYFLQALFCFLALRFRVRPPGCHRRQSGASNPGKEKQKRYYYRSGVLIVHKFRLLLCFGFSSKVFTGVLRKIRLEVTRKIFGETRAGAVQ